MPAGRGMACIQPALVIGLGTFDGLLQGGGERLAGGVVSAGDTLVGNFSRAGRTTVKDRQTNAELVVFVDDFALAKSAAQRKITESCK